jgi:hypothetical protein
MVVNGGKGRYVPPITLQVAELNMEGSQCIHRLPPINVSVYMYCTVRLMFQYARGRRRFFPFGIGGYLLQGVFPNCYSRSG